jgi:hypothetical protein
MVYQWYGNDFGLGLPITGTFSNVNFGFELGRDHKSRSCSGENYANLSVSFSLTTNGLKNEKIQQQQYCSASCLYKSIMTLVQKKYIKLVVTVFAVTLFC